MKKIIFALGISSVLLGLPASADDIDLEGKVRNCLRLPVEAKKPVATPDQPSKFSRLVKWCKSKMKTSPSRWSLLSHEEQVERARLMALARATSMGMAGI